MEGPKDGHGGEVQAALAESDIEDIAVIGPIQTGGLKAQDLALEISQMAVATDQLPPAAGQSNQPEDEAPQSAEIERESYQYQDRGLRHGLSILDSRGEGERSGAVISKGKTDIRCQKAEGSSQIVCQ